MSVVSIGKLKTGNNFGCVPLELSPEVAQFLDSSQSCVAVYGCLKAASKLSQNACQKSGLPEKWGKSNLGRRVSETGSLMGRSGRAGGEWVAGSVSSCRAAAAASALVGVRRCVILALAVDTSDVISSVCTISASIFHHFPELQESSYLVQL